MTNGTRHTYRIGISGSYGGMNLGDEAILSCIIGQLRRSLPCEITVFSRDPEYTLLVHKVERAVPVLKLSHDEIVLEMERLDLFILGGGGIIFDGDVKTYLREVTVAHELRVPVMIYAVGAGPLRDPSNQEHVRANFDKAAVITVRERSAKKILEEAGVTADILITADPALLLKPEPLPHDALRNEGIYGDRRLICVSVREPGAAAPDINERSYHTIVANAADFMIDRFDADIVFIPMERRFLDLQHSHAIMSQMLRPEKATVLKGTYTSGQLLTLMQHFVFSVGMRLHFLIFSALQGVPFVALPYASKVSGFLEALDIDSPPLHLINSGRVIAHIDSVWDNRAGLISKVKRSLPGLKKRAEETNTIAVELLKNIYSLSKGKKEKAGATA